MIRVARQTLNEWLRTSTKGVVVVVIVGEIRIRPRRKKKEKKGETEV